MSRSGLDPPGIFLESFRRQESILFVLAPDPDIWVFPIAFSDPEDVVLEDELAGEVFQSFLFPIFVQVNFVVLPFTFDVLTAPNFVHELPEVAANVMEFEIEKIKRTVSEILEIFNIAKQ